MSLSFSNVVAPNAAQNALNSKLTPEPLSPASLANAGRLGIGTGVKLTAPNNTANGALGGTIAKPPVAAAAKIPAALPAKAPAAAPAPAPVATAAASYGTAPQANTMAPYTQPSNNYYQGPPSGGLVGNLVAPASYSGMVNSVGGAAGSLNSQAGAINNTANQIGAQGQMTPEESAARQKLAALPGALAEVNANIEAHPSDSAFQMGREAIASRSIEGQRQSLADQVSAFAAQRAASTEAFKGQAAAQQGAGGVINQAGGLYNSAAGLAQPQLAGFNQQAFNPLDSSFSGSGASDAAVQQQVAQVKAGKSAQQALSDLSAYGQPAVDALNKALGTNFNFNANAGSAAAGQHNAALASSATPDAYNSIYQGALSDYTNLTQSVQNVDGFGNLLTSNMTSGGINPTDVKYANKTLAQIRGQLSSSAQAQYDTTLAALRSKISGMLSIGGNETPTAITADAHKILDGSLPLNQLNDVLNRIQGEGNILLTNQAAKVNAAKAGTMGPGASAPAPAAGGGGSSGGNVSAGGYSFVQQNGKWVPAPTA